MPSRQGARRRGRGFTLLEAIVALAILATAGLALFAAMSQSVQMVQRAQQARDADAVLRNALAIIDRVNPMESPAGSMPLGDYELRWQSELVEPALDSDTGQLHPGYFEVGLYQVHLELWRGNAMARDLTLRRAGYRQVRLPPRL